MRKMTRAMFGALIGLALAAGGGLVASEAEALVFCAKTKNPSKIKVRGDACKVGKETEVSIADLPAVQAELDALEASLLASLGGQNQVVAFGSVYHFTAGNTCVLQNLNSANVMAATYDMANERCDITFSDFAFSINTHVAVVSGSVPGSITGHQSSGDGALRLYAETAAGGDVPGGTLIQFVVLEP